MNDDRYFGTAKGCDYKKQHKVLRLLLILKLRLETVWKLTSLSLSPLKFYATEPHPFAA